MKNNLFESIKSNLKEGTTYSCAPSFTEEDGFYSNTNTEALESARDVAKYFADYATFLTEDEEGQRYVDREMAPLFAEFAKQTNEFCDKLMSAWDKVAK